MAYLVILNNGGDVGSKVMAVAPFEGSDQGKEILTDWAEMCIEQIAYLEIPFIERDFEQMVECLAEFEVSVEVVDGM